MVPKRDRAARAGVAWGKAMRRCKTGKAYTAFLVPCHFGRRPPTEGLDPRSKAVPLRFTVPLTDVEPGRYEAQVSVLDPGGTKAAFWRAPIVVVP